MMNLDRSLKINQIKNLKRKARFLDWLFLGIFLSFINIGNAYAGSALLVNAVEGRAFAIKNDKISELKANDQIDDSSEIMVEENGQVSFMDFQDHKYHLSGGGNIKINKKVIELRNGYLWVQSFNEKDSYYIQTANSSAAYKKGEVILSFDNVSGKSQALALHGKIQFNNL